MEAQFTIEKEADGKAIASEEHIHLRLESSNNSGDVTLRIDAPFYNNRAPPGGVAGQPYFRLWDYEVVEAFFLNDKKEYLEVEVGPHGQHIVLLLKGERNIVSHSLQLIVKTKIVGKRWTGEAVIPGIYFPPQVTKFNAFGIFDVNDHRRYVALYPSDGSTKEVDFHNLTFFRFINWAAINPLHNKNTDYSTVWEEALKGTDH